MTINCTSLSNITTQPSFPIVQPLSGCLSNTTTQFKAPDPLPQPSHYWEIGCRHILQLSPWSKSVVFCCFVLQPKINFVSHFAVSVDTTSRFTAFRMFSTVWKIHFSNRVSCRNETGSFNKWFEITPKSHIEWNPNQNLVGLFWLWKLISNFVFSVKGNMWCFEMQVIDGVKFMHHNAAFIEKKWHPVNKARNHPSKH